MVPDAKSREGTALSMDEQRTPKTNPPDAPENAGLPRRSRGWWWVVAIIALALVGVGLLLRRPSPAEQAAGAKSPPPLMIDTTNAHQGDIGVYVNALGAVTPLNTVSIRSRVDGQLVKVSYVEGQTVHQGD